MIYIIITARPSHNSMHMIYSLYRIADVCGQNILRNAQMLVCGIYKSLLLLTN